MSNDPTSQGQPSGVGDLESLLLDYRRLEGVPDELIGDDGAVRPVWRDLIAALAAMAPEEISARIARADQYLRDAGVFYRQYGPEATAERDWPLSHFPLLVDEAEWDVICDGLVQRAELLESILADIYGPNRLVADGALPAPLVAGNAGWLRPLVGAMPPSDNFLHFIAFDIGRGPDGKWWVLSDRTQAPSGAGFALENRIATSRMYADVYGRANVERLAGFFRDFRDALLQLREGDDSRVAILTPGPMNDTYYEHAYIARYLGFNLLEGEDLAVRQGRLLVRTVNGLAPVSVLWRRLDAHWADPLELKEESRLGTPGLIGAIRNGSVGMINALGSGILETRAFLAFMPRICEKLRGEPLRLPNIATWWCGQENERAHVKANAQSMTIGDAYSARLPFETDDVSAIGGVLNTETRETVDAWIDRNAERLVGQEAVTLSTTPALVDGALVPRPMSLRVFAARTPTGWRVMPGGFARIGHSGNTPELALQSGGSVADVWIVRKDPVDKETSLAPAVSTPRAQPSLLPSRAADNLYWLGRYVERAENLVRLTRAYHLRLAETAYPDSPLLNDLAAYMGELDIDPVAGFPEGVQNALSAAANSAGHVRDRFSLDGWLALSDIDKTVRELALTATPGDGMARAMGVLLRKLSGFSGLVHENMYRYTGWRLLSSGRSLERALSMVNALAHFCHPGRPEGALDLVVEIGDSAMTHRRSFAVAVSRETVLDLLALDPLNPRAVMHQFDTLQEHFSALPGAEEHRPTTRLQRTMLKTYAALSVCTAPDLDTSALLALATEVIDLSAELERSYYR